jgi:hypothetical protein
MREITVVYRETGDAVVKLDMSAPLSEATPSETELFPTAEAADVRVEELVTKFGGWIRRIDLRKKAKA